MAKKLLIVQPSCYHSRFDSTVVRIRKRRVVPLTLPYLAALTPPDWDVKLVDEQLDGIDFEERADLVAITVLTINSLRSYEVATRFRQKGIPTVMGGPHVFFHLEEASQHCDAVGIGEGETIWRQILEDAEAGRLKRIYRSNRPSDLRGLPLPRYSLLNMKKYGLFRTFAVQSSRGCPFKCDFCSERFYSGERYRFRPVGEIIEEIRECRARYVLFADSNFAGQLDHAMELMEALVPLKLRWSALWSFHLCANREFMDLAQRSGLLHLNIGLESVDPLTLDRMNKKINIFDHGAVLRDLRKRGISYSLNLIFGSDTEREDIFETTLSFLFRNKVPAAYLNILTPHKGTPLYERLRAESRILDIQDIGRWPGIGCHIKPLKLSPAELVQHVEDLHGRFYSYRSMLMRLPLPLTKASIASWAINVAEKKSFRNRAENFSQF